MVAREYPPPVSVDDTVAVVLPSHGATAVFPPGPEVTVDATARSVEST